MAKKKVVGLSEEHKQLAERIGFDPVVLAAVVDYNLPDLRQLMVERPNEKYVLEPVAENGFCFDAERFRAQSLLSTLRTKFEHRGYLFFLTDLGVEEPPATVAVIRGDDPFDVLRMMGTEDVNGDQTTDDIIAILTEWRTRHQFRITGAGRDWVECRFSRGPSDWFAFADALRSVAPDSYSQSGYESVDDFIADMRRARSFQLWWD